MNDTLTVRAREGVRCPREGLAKNPITADKDVVVANTPYYRRRLRDGDLVEVPESPAPPKRSPPGKGGQE